MGSSAAVKPAWTQQKLIELAAAIAARDLGVQLGNFVTLRHPRRSGPLAYDWVKSQVVVSRLHALPLRSQQYMDLDQARMMNLTGLVNCLQLIPGPDISQDTLKRRFFDQVGIASVQTVSVVIHVFEELIGEFVDMFLIMEAAAVILAGLMAYSSVTINLDERQREVATMFAYGVPIRGVLRLAIVETLITSLVGPAFGCGLGLLLLNFMLRSIFVSTVPTLT